MNLREATEANGYFLGFDVGGSRLKSGVVRPDGRVERPAVVDTEHRRWEPVFEIVLGQAAEHVDALGPDGLRGIGVAVPGLVEATYGCRNLPGKVLGIEDFPLVDTLSRAFGNVVVRCVNDGAAATLAEWRFGAARGYDDLVGFTLGTGLGAGVIVNGRPLENGNLGTGVSLGHFTIQAGGKLCLCGNVGCAETLISADAVVARLREALHRSVPSVLSARYFEDPRSITFPAFVEGLAAGDAVCEEVIADFRRNLGAEIVTAIHAFNPSAVVLAGGPMAAAEHFLPDVQAYVDRHAFVYPKDRRVPILRAKLETHAGVLGAVALAMTALEDTQALTASDAWEPGPSSGSPQSAGAP